MRGPDKELRDKIAWLHQRADADPVLARAFSEDPKGTLEANGIDTRALTFDDTGATDVAGYMLNTSDRDDHDECLCMWHNGDGTCGLWFCL